jgi:hypothetical protein
MDYLATPKLQQPVEGQGTIQGQEMRGATG